MKAGRELDALIAEKVMGWKVNYDNWTVAKPHFSKPDTFWCVSLKAGDWAAFTPSTQIADAWLVVEKLIGQYEFMVQAIDGERWIAVFFHEAEADTAPLAICLAALKAVE